MCWSMERPTRFLIITSTNMAMQATMGTRRRMLIAMNINTSIAISMLMTTHLMLAMDL